MDCHSFHGNVVNLFHGTSHHVIHWHSLLIARREAKWLACYAYIVLPAYCPVCTEHLGRWSESTKSFIFQIGSQAQCKKGHR